MNRTEKAYQLGYRATVDGKLLLNGQDMPINIKKKNSGRDLLYFVISGINGAIYLSKLQAFLTYGEKAFGENCLYIDGNTSNCSKNNITLKSIYKKQLLKENKYYCSSCNKVLDKSYFYDCDLKEENCPYRIAQCKICRLDRVRNNRKYMANKKASGCVVCGEKDTSCLDFHHIKDKYDQVSHMLTHSLNKINLEINKCIVLCANCHRKLHYYNLTLDQLKKCHNDRF